MKNRYNSTLAVLLISAGVANAQLPFKEIDTNFTAKTVVIPQSPLKVNPIFSGNKDYVYNRLMTDSSLAKQNHDFTGLSKINENEIYLVVNHEVNQKNAVIGDGGGMTVFKMKKINGEWQREGKFRSVDFSFVGGTAVNCGGAQTPWGHVMTAEEFPVANNAALAAGFRDTSDWTIPNDATLYGPYAGKTIKRYKNFGFMVSVDPADAKAVAKWYGMGKYSHEHAYIMPDEKTVFLTDDNTPGVFFKFVATNPRNFNIGQLYAYKQSKDGQSGSWLSLPMELDSLMDIRNIALRKGATTFNRLEWIEGAPNGKIYFTETGVDKANHKSAIAMGGYPAHHLRSNIQLTGAIPNNDTVFYDYYGRINEFDPSTNVLRSYLEGGTATNDSKKNLASPDGIAIVSLNGKTWLVINEDLIGSSLNRQPASNPGNNICEIYFCDLGIANPSVNDLKRFHVSPAGAENTGGVFTPDASAYIVNIQHPSSTNLPPYNNSTTVVISGMWKYDPTSQEELTEAPTFSIYPNPATRELRFNVKTDVAIYDLSGRKIMVERDTDLINVSNLRPGVYFIQTIDNQVQKLIVQ